LAPAFPGPSESGLPRVTLAINARTREVPRALGSIEAFWQWSVAVRPLQGTKQQHRARYRLNW